MTVDDSHKSPTKKDMVYFEDSPDFCTSASESKFTFGGLWLIILPVTILNTPVTPFYTVTILIMAYVWVIHCHENTYG